MVVTLIFPSADPPNSSSELPVTFCLSRLAYFGHFLEVESVVFCDLRHSLTVMLLKFIHVAAGVSLWLNISLYGHSRYCLPRTQLINVWVVSTFWLPVSLHLDVGSGDQIVTLLKLLRNVQAVFQSGCGIWCPCPPAVMEGPGTVLAHRLGFSAPSGCEVVSRCGWVVSPYWLVVSAIVLCAYWLCLLWGNGSSDHVTIFTY